jgi:opacity protein-like surface antigen
MSRKSHFVWSAALGAIMLSSGALAADMAPAPAQAPPAALPFQLSVTPYFWAATIDGSATLQSLRRPGASVTADFKQSFGDILSKLDGIPFMGAAELRFGRFIVLGDLIYTPLGQDFTTRNLLFNGGRGGVTDTIVTGLAFYRLYETAGLSVDLGGGVRNNTYKVNIDLNPGLLPGESLGKTFSWTYPVAAARVRAGLTDNLGLSLYGDYGTSGSGKNTWQVSGTFDYKVSANVDVRLGYRYLAFEHRGTLAALEVNMHGPVFGANFRF